MRFVITNNLLKKILDYYLIFFFSILIFLMIELTLSLLFPREVIIIDKLKLAENEIAYRYNHFYLIALKPNIKNYYKRSISNGAELISWQTNSDSFRGKELKEKSKYRIMVYGDSNIQGIFSSEKNIFTSKLETLLKNKSDKDIEIINAGINGAGPDQYLLKFMNEVNIYKPEMVIFNIFADNDYGDIIRNRLFELDDSTQELKKTVFKREIDSVLINPHVQVSFSDLVSSLLIVRKSREAINSLLRLKNKSNSAANSLINQYENNLDYQFSIYERGSRQRVSHFADCYDLDVACLPNSYASKIKIRLMSKLLRQIKNFAESKKIKFLVVIEPSVVDLTKNFYFNYEILREKFPGYKRNNLSGFIKNACIKNKIDFINLFDAFLRNNPDSLFFKGSNNHWNDRGQAVAAKETAKFILHEFTGLSFASLRINSTSMKKVSALPLN